MEKTIQNQLQEQQSQAHYYMKRAIMLAKKGMGYTNPNPMVGAVIVKDGNIIGEGYHKTYGTAHAEVHALNNCKVNPEGATMYVTLEPCSHIGKTPPCVDAIIGHGINEVVIGMIDPNPLVAGKGVQKLQNQGIDVTYGMLESEVKSLNRMFMKYVTTKQPYCILKSAMTLDGKIATKIGDSQWVTGELARQHVHELRHQMSGIMVGIGTVLADNPRLTTRLRKRKGKNPIRIILDTTCRIPLDAALLREEGKTIICTGNHASPLKIKKLQEMGVEVYMSNERDGRLDMACIMDYLGDRGIDSVLIEGGSSVSSSALEAGVVDEVMMFIAPKIIGGKHAKSPVGGEGVAWMRDAIGLVDIEIETLGTDILIKGKVEEA
ncbi:bifunctional diaminohydroxyphosphoribosylaminopyrimidine deaminase/5-amino-6-(5-phosphoribosylamino)uracil reductase RibD [Vallitalea pronyensis]|nr:bifunctional diaminohydroxyphosphoribosylaminopyrimidine deaminase/5-amino-6-(5-phosphoribosylamino)uracil reductase RibD [Vallitalea pronyensis]